MHMSPQSPTASFDEIAAFTSVATQGSFAEAARRLDVDPSLLSRRVRRLEERLNVRLFARTTRKVTLTEAGERYLSRVAELMEQLEAAGREAAELSATPQGVLRVSLPISFGQRVVAPMIADFVRRYPKIRLDLSFTNRRVDLVAEGFDLSIRAGVPRDSTLTMRRLASYREVLLASPDYLSAHGQPQNPDDLADHACLGFTGNAFWPEWRLTDGVDKYAFRPHGPIQSDSSEAVLAAAISGAGIILAPEWLAADALRSQKVMPVLPGWQGMIDGAIFGLLPPGRMTPAKVKVFLDHLTEKIARQV
ncbi:MAG: LysR substrate-binding domain-containing protein [Paracoccus sp. (in: a-proteobacteria)]|nr:LysR substrate-binding domain-containing protein [Paracoccus sp. (in: a-proteobacteria)]